MREINFRGINNDGNWSFGDLIQSNNEHNVWIHSPKENHTYKVDPATVGQYTGLKDLTGKEIYEGDIVEISPQFSAKQGLKRKFHLFAVVRWDERLARFVVISKEILDSIPDSECVSVIGNIHDNPEFWRQRYERL